ncbi:type IV secretory system conjugative DNA transfer family protein [Novosphingobium sp.]|uniref:type IV secretory system conjugative DNA transfer family protein n=1 Tax=Novosphingobium sp. TaxID=1874826 RepID=UPI0038B8FD6C
MKAGDLDTPLLRLSGGDNWTIRDALMHQLVLGTTGSGKTSSTMKHTVGAMLTAGFGMLFCIAKPEDATFIKTLCQQAGRRKSVIEITATRGAFNPLAWAMARTGNINDAIDLLDHMIEIVRSSGPAAGKMGDEFWSSSKTAMLRATIPVIWAATGTVRIEDVIALIRHAPTSLDQFKDPEWQKDSPFYHFFRLAAERLAQGPVSGFDDEIAERALSYWREMASLDAKTLGNIRITLTTALSRFQTGLLKRMFCGGTDTVPELVFHSALLILNIPVQVYGDDGAIAQKIWKYCTQKACLTRNALDKRQSRVPVGIVADEADCFFYNDAEFLARCRSALVAVVFATQSIPTIRARIGGDNAHDRAEHLISNFNTVVLHSSACPVTNTWFSNKIGRSFQQRGTYNESHGSGSNWSQNMGQSSNWGGSSQSGGSTSSGGNGGGSSSSSWGSGSSWGGGDNVGRSNGCSTNSNVSHGYSVVLENIFEPGFFGRGLKTGGPANRNRVSAVWMQAGRSFANGGNATIVEFKQ